MGIWCLSQFQLLVAIGVANTVRLIALRLRSKRCRDTRAENQQSANVFSRLGFGESSLEQAGVGGSTPSLATIFFNHLGSRQLPLGVHFWV